MLFNVPGGAVGRLRYTDDDEACELSEAPVQLRFKTEMRVVELTSLTGMAVPDVSLSFEAWLAATHRNCQRR